MGRARWLCEGISHKLTIWIGARYGQNFPMHFVCGYPRSGTTWFSEMLADYLNLPRPRHYIFPIGFASVIHTHSEPNSSLNDCFYIIRDGRDSYVSAYFKLIRLMKNNDFVYRNYYLKKFGKSADLEDIKTNLPVYLEERFRKKRNWGKHAAGWFNKSQKSANIVIVKYEELLLEPTTVFINALSKKYGNVDLKLAEETAKKHLFESQKNRPANQHRTFMRKGEMGDWKNHFTKTSAEIFDHYAGQELINFGYEKDNLWIKNF